METIANAKPAPSTAPALIRRQVNRYIVTPEIKVNRNEDRSSNTVFVPTVRQYKFP
jgi:hypothetical protein